MKSSSALVLTAGALLGLGAGVGASLLVSPRSAHADSVVVQSTRIAAVDVLLLAKQMLESDRYSPAREALAKDRHGQIEVMRNELQELGAKIQAAGQNTPEAAPMLEQFQGKRAAYEQAGQAAEMEFNQLLSTQFHEAYRLIAETAESIAKKQGFAYVVASRTGPITFETKDFQAAVQEVLSRPVLMHAEGDDLTEQVRAELKIPAKTEAAPTVADPKPADPPANNNR